MNRFSSFSLMCLLAISTRVYAEDSTKEVEVICHEDPSGEICEEVPVKKVDLKTEEIKNPKTQNSEKKKTQPSDVSVKKETPKSHDKILNSPTKVNDEGIHIGWNKDIENNPQSGSQHRWRLGIGGYLRAGYTNIVNDISGNYGTNDGFGLDSARLSINAYFDDTAGFKFQIDGAVHEQLAPNDPNAGLVVRTKDAFIWYAPIEYVKISVGQFKAPFDGEGIDSSTDIAFISRSVMSRGVKGVEGPNVRGLSRDREVGATLSTDGIYFDEKKEGFGIRYALGATNGSSSDRALNDNDALAFYGRLDFLYGKMVRVGGGATMNDRTIGLAPNQLDESVFGWAADLSLNIAMVSLAGGVIGETITNPTQDEFSRFGLQATLAVREPFLGFQPKVRFSSLDDSSSREGEALSYISFGINYVPKDFPLRVMLDYTLSGEEAPTEIDNNKLELLLEASW